MSKKHRTEVFTSDLNTVIGAKQAEELDAQGQPVFGVVGSVVVVRINEGVPEVLTYVTTEKSHGMAFYHYYDAEDVNIPFIDERVKVEHLKTDTKPPLEKLFDWGPAEIVTTLFGELGGGMVMGGESYFTGDNDMGGADILRPTIVLLLKNVDTDDALPHAWIALDELHEYVFYDDFSEYMKPFIIAQADNFVELQFQAYETAAAGHPIETDRTLH